MRTDFIFKIIKLDENGCIVSDGIKKLYCLNSSNLNDWIKKPIENFKNKIEFPNFSSGIKIKDDEAKKLDGSIAEFVVDQPQVQYNQTTICIMVGPMYSAGHHTISILPQNFLRCVSAFTARKVIQQNWLNDKDEYMAPNEQHPKFQQFQNDSIIFSLFDTSSQQTSLRNIQYHNKTWNIRNNFFWCSNSWIKALAELYNNEQVYNDLIQYPTDPYVYTLIGQKITNREPFGKTALDVLSKASHLLETTFQYRNEFNNEHPEYQVCNWDAGWYQIKQLCKKYKEEEYKEFRELFIQFRKELEPLVYELGFLKE